MGFWPPTRLTAPLVRCRCYKWRHLCGEWDRVLFLCRCAKSVEKWDFLHNKKTAAVTGHCLTTRSKGSSWKWEKVKGLKDGRFSRDAIDAVGWRGKLCMVNVKGHAAKEGLVYDTEKDAWEDMPEGMLAGWKGPVAAMDEEVIGSNNGGIVVLDVVAMPVRLWILETPPGFEAVAVHILPRMSQPDLLFPVPP
ncbi:hypothetical protein GH714_004663 [Hevea brasiliensis]|uniref:F-box/kelch-repeat protein SKIP25 n=1 Tax=Hevea brasiliensis TaxID=3981 RepID=A0A6A6N9F0_HEVBR|nr:hypothetical protein GH714_004663 [Hevea brasiliensis]